MAMHVSAKLQLRIPKEVCKSMEVDNYTKGNFKIILKCENNTSTLIITTNTIGSLKSTLDDFFRCLNASLETYKILKQISNKK